jgi:transposase
MRLFGVVYGTGGNFHDGSQKGPASVHQILCHLGKSAMETLTMIQQVFGDRILSQTQVFQRHARFKTGRTSDDEDKHTGRPKSYTTPETVVRIQELIRQNQCWITHDIAEEVGNGYGTCQNILTKEFGMHCVAAKFVPRILTADQKQRVNILTQQFMPKHYMIVIPHPPYSPDLALCDFFLFPKMKLKLKGRRFDSTEEIQTESQGVLDTLTEKDFQ